MNLFKISEQYRQLDALLEESGGVLTPDIEKALDINEKNRDVAFKNLYYLLKEKQADLPGIKQTIEELQEIQEKRKLQIESYTKQLIIGLETFGDQKIDGKKLTLRPSQACITEGLETQLRIIMMCLGDRKFTDVIKVIDSEIVIKDIEVKGRIAAAEIENEFLIDIYNLITEGLISEELTLSIKPKKKELTTYINTEQKDVPGAYIEHRNNLSVK